MKNRATPIILDRLDAALRAQGVELARSQLLETAAAAFGYHNQEEFSSASKAGTLTPPAAGVLGTVDIGDERIVVLRDVRSGMPYAVDESFVEQAVETERRERFGPSPYGGLVDLSEVAAHPATAWGFPAAGEVAAADQGRRFHSFRGDGGAIGAYDDEGEARESCRDGEGMDYDAYVVDALESLLMRARCAWRPEAIAPVGSSFADRVAAAAALAMERHRAEEVQDRLDTVLRIDVPDWRAWEKDLKKASYKGSGPISDELLHQIRHACADVTSKSTSSEKFEVTYRQQRYVEKHLGGLLARLDQAEDALRAAGLAPSEIARKSKDDAAERLAAIEAVKPRNPGRTIPNLYEVEATRDGDKCHEYYLVDQYEHWEDKGRAIACKAFRMGDLEDHRDGDGGFDAFDAECDTFEVREVGYPDAAAIISDALGELATGGDFRYGIPMDHPARIKLIAAREMITPKPTA